MSTMNDEQESSTLELTNLMDVVAAETGKPETETEMVVESAAVVIEETAVVIEEAVVEEAVAIEETAVIETITEIVEEAVPETAVVKTAVVEEKPVNPPKHQKQQRKQRPKRNSAVTSKDVQRWFASCGRCGFFLSAYGLLETEIDLETAVSRSKGDWLALEWNYKIRNLVNKSYGHHVDIGYLDTGCPECRRRLIIDADGDERSFRIALNPAIKK